MFPERVTKEPVIRNAGHGKHFFDILQLHSRLFFSGLIFCEEEIVFA